MKPKIVILGHYPSSALRSVSEPKASGAHPTWLCQYAKGLQKYADTFDIHWITIHKGAALQVEHLDQTFHFLSRWKHTVQLATGYISERRKICKLIKEIKPDLVHAWGTEDVYALAATDTKLPSIVSMQGILNLYKQVRGVPFFMKIQSYFESMALKKATLVTVESNWGKNKLKKLHPHKDIKCVEYGIDPKYYEVDWEPAPQPLAIFVGSINRAKGTDILIEVFNCDRLRKMNLKVVGSGLSSYVELLKSRAGDNIEFTGPLSSDAVKKELSQAWCLVLPTLCDTSPNVVKEARVIGLPVVTTPYGGQVDYIQDGSNGYVIEPNNKAGLTNALMKLLSDITLCRSLGESMRSEARECFRSDLTVEKMVNLYRSYLT